MPTLYAPMTEHARRLLEIEATDGTEAAGAEYGRLIEDMSPSEASALRDEFMRLRGETDDSHDLLAFKSRLLAEMEAMAVQYQDHQFALALLKNRLGLEE